MFYSSIWFACKLCLIIYCLFHTLSLSTDSVNLRIIINYSVTRENTYSCCFPALFC